MKNWAIVVLILLLMAYPSYEDNGGIAYGASGSVSASYMGTVDADDILIANTVASGNQTFTTPSGYTLMGQTSGSLGSMATFWRRATGSESGSVTLVNSGSGDSYGIIIRYSGCVASGTPFEDFTTDGPANNETIPIPSIDTTGVERLATAIYDIISSTADPNAPTDYTEIFNVNTTSGTDASITMSTQEIATASTVSADSATLGREARHLTHVFAFIPVAGATDDLTAQNILSGTPVISQPTLSIIHVLIAQNILSGIPEISQSDISQVHNLNAQDILSGIPYITRAAIDYLAELKEGFCFIILTDENIVKGVYQTDDMALGSDWNGNFQFKKLNNLKIAKVIAFVDADGKIFKLR